MPTWLHFRTQNPSKSMKKSIPRGLQKMIDFWIDFLPKLAPFWDPCWDPRAAQDGPKTSPRIFFKFSKTPPGQLKSHKSIQDRNLVHFWSQKPMGYPPGPRFSRFLARLNSSFGAKFALGNLESFTPQKASRKSVGSLKKYLNIMAWTSYGKYGINFDGLLKDLSTATFKNVSTFV